MQTMWHKCLFSLATAAFVMITLLTLMDDGFAHTAFRAVLAFYSLTMIALEILQFTLLSSETLLQLVSRVLGVLGYLTFIEAAYLYCTFNKGNIYIVGSFLISASALLKLLRTILIKPVYPCKPFSHAYSFFRLASLGGVGLFFFITSIAQGFQDYYSYYTLILVAKASNTIAATCHVVAVYNMIKEEDFKNTDKVKFEASAGELDSRCMQ